MTDTPIEPEIVSTQALTVRPSSGLPTVQDLEQQFELAVRQRELLSQYIKKQLVPGKHFYQRGTQKPSLAKEGAEIILLPHNLAPDYEQIGGPDSPPADGRPYQITVKCVLRRKGDPSSFVGSGIGSAGSEKQKKDGTYIHRQEDKYLCHNATLKMAQKSAMIAATINSTAASEFFTQDMDEPGQSEPEPQYPHKPEPPAKPAAPKFAERAAHFPTEKFRTKMISELKAGLGEPNRMIVEEYFRKLENPSQLMPGEELESLPLRFVPATKEQMLALHSKIMGFSSGEPAAPAFPPHPEPEDTKPSPKPKAAASSDESWRNVIISLPRKGMKRDEYLANPDTIGSLFDLRHGNDEEAQAARQRLFGLLKWEPKPREFKGKIYQPSDSDWATHKGLQQFAAWFAANHPGEEI